MKDAGSQPRMPQAIETVGSGAAPASDLRDSPVDLGAPDLRLTHRRGTLPPYCDRIQAAVRAIELGLRDLPKARIGAAALQILDPERRLWLAGCAALSLTPEVAEGLAEAILSDLQAGSPVPPFDGIREEAALWAAFASPAELKWYLVEIWNRLSDDDRRSFLLRVAAPAELRRALG